MSPSIFCFSVGTAADIL